MIVFTPTLAVRVVRGHFLQVKFQSAQNTYRVEPFPWLAEREADRLVVRDRALRSSTTNCGAKDVTRGFTVLIGYELPSSAGPYTYAELTYTKLR